MASFYGCCLMYSLFATVFLASKTALSEQTQRTLNFSLALPLSRKSLAWVRLIGGISTLVVPVVLGALLLTPVLILGVIEQVPRRPIPYLGQFENRESLSAISAVGMLWSLAVVAMVQSTTLFLILAVFGARRRFESHIGFFGAVMALSWAILGAGRDWFDVDFRNSYGGWLGALFPQSLVINYGYATERGSYTDLDIGNPFWLPLLVNLPVMSGLCVWFVSRYATRAQPAAISTRRWRWSLLSRVPNVLPGRWGALVWMNLRQAVPLATAGLLLAILLAVVQILSENGRSGLMLADQVLPGNMWFVATLWATVVASGIFAAELRPRLAGFWRSRPLAVNQWFWTKWIVGLIAVLGVLDGVTIMVSWGTPIEQTRGLSLSYIATMVPLHAMMYSLAVFGVCWLRRPVAGAMLAVIAFFFGSMGIEAIFGSRFEPIHVYNSMLTDEISGGLNLSANAYPFVYGTIIALTIFAAIAAARSIRHPESASLL